MKFELKTENENYLNSFSQVLGIIFILASTIILSDITLKLGIISRNYQIDYKCKLLAVKKTNTNFKKLSKASNLKSKQLILEFCREFIK